VWGGDIMVKNLFDFLVTAIETETLEHTSLENESREYRHASQEAENCYRKIKTILPPEMQETLLRFDDERNLMEGAGIDVYYRKGFSDAIRFLIQAMLWEPGRN
jgi:hypothetical protein